MKYSILGFNQEMVMKTSLDLTDLFLLKYINEACGSPKMYHEVDENKNVYVWLSHKKIQEDLPALRISEGTLKNRLCNLKQRGYIVTITKSDEKGRGSRSYYGLTELTDLLLYTSEEETTTSRENYVVKGPRNESVTSYNIVNNDNQSNNLLKNKLLDSDSSSDFLRSITKKSKPNLYDRCVSHIKMCTEDKQVQEQLIVFLDSLCEMQKLKGENQFKGILKKLNGYTAKEQLEMISYSIEKGYGTFYPIDKKVKGKTGSAVIDIEGFDHVAVDGSNKEYKAKMKQEIENGQAKKF